jgi:hypothetical protein
LAKGGVNTPPAEPGFIELKTTPVAFTMDTYSHIISEMEEDIMALPDEALPAGITGVAQASKERQTANLQPCRGV